MNYYPALNDILPPAGVLSAGILSTEVLSFRDVDRPKASTVDASEVSDWPHAIPDVRVRGRIIRSITCEAGRTQVGIPDFTAGSQFDGPKRLAGFDRLERAVRSLRFPQLVGGMYAEAVYLLDVIGLAKITKLPAPEVGVSEQEISIGWTNRDAAAIVSLEGDGEAAYTYRVGRRFKPGEEVFMVNRGSLPEDLRAYLERMYA